MDPLPEPAQEQESLPVPHVHEIPMPSHMIEWLFAMEKLGFEFDSLVAMPMPPVPSRQNGIRF